MNILLTNDDGYDQPGIVLLKEELGKYGTVYICAPDEHQSGKSGALSLQVGLKLTKHNDYLYSCSGTPVDAVKIGVAALNTKFDLIVSGCNDGYNLSYDTIYSGTVGAGLEGLIQRIPTICFSTNFKDYSAIKKYTQLTMDYLLSNDLISNEYLLNINFPNNLLPYKGLMLTALHYRNCLEFVYEKGGLKYHQRKELETKYPQNTDLYAVNHGYISITPLQKTLFSETLLTKLKEKIN